MVTAKTLAFPDPCRQGTSSLYEERRRRQGIPRSEVIHDRRLAEPPSAWAQQQDDARDEFDVDYGRFVHDGSFRRLQGKTQILNLRDSDLFRTLTHSLEVAQIAGRRECASLRRPVPTTRPFRFCLLSLIQTSDFCHDLGHPPFGHGGEAALNDCMRAHCGLEGNGQTLRILARLENFSREHGADLTRGPCSPSSNIRSRLPRLRIPVSTPRRLRSAPRPFRLQAPENVQHLEFEGQKLVVSVFEAIQSDPKSLLPADA
jgi:dGTPase